MLQDTISCLHLHERRTGLQNGTTLVTCRLTFDITGAGGLIAGVRVDGWVSRHLLPPRANSVPLRIMTIEIVVPASVKARQTAACCNSGSASMVKPTPDN